MDPRSVIETLIVRTVDVFVREVLLEMVFLVALVCTFYTIEQGFDSKMSNLKTAMAFSYRSDKDTQKETQILYKHYFSQ